MAHRVLAIFTDGLHGEEPIEEIRRAGNDTGVDLRVICPAVEANAFRHTLGDIDEPKVEAEERLQQVLAALRASGIEAAGEVGDPDPVQAAQDALLEAPADEVLLFEHEEAQARWFEGGLFERAQEGLEPPLRMIALHSDGAGTPDHVVEVEEAGPGLYNPDEGHEIGGSYLPGLSRGDFAGMVFGIFGTIIVAILAAAVAAKGGQESGPEAAAILIAIGVALVNLAHVVGLTLMESVRYRGGFATFFRLLALIGTPLAILANLLLLVLA
ncbi:MAG TPA: hypothetical protein VFB52_07170 [Solirubrobacterales bacterium]|nr:hypothetical protein [Solirubrobacterales bacterium]